MTAFVLSLLLKLWPIIVGVLGWLGARLYYKRQGAAEERAKQAAAEAKARTIADEIDDAIAGRSPDENRKELRKWSKS